MIYSLCEIFEVEYCISSAIDTFDEMGAIKWNVSTSSLRSMQTFSYLMLKGKLEPTEVSLRCEMKCRIGKNTIRRRRPNAMPMVAM